MMRKSPAVLNVSRREFPIDSGVAFASGKGAKEPAMVRLRSLPWLCLLLLVIPTSAHGQAWSGIINSSRAVDWSSAGTAVPTNWTQCGSTIAAYGSSGSPASPATINNAIAACAPNTYVQLGAGTFYLNSGLLVNSHNNVEIRGMGANSTFLALYGNNGCQGVYASICFQSSDVNWKNGPSNGPVNWTAGYSKGTTTITLASVPNLKVGNPIILQQIDDATDNGQPIVCQSTASPVCSLQGNGGGAQMLNQDQSQIVTVTGCGGVTTPGASCSGTNVSVTISPGLYMPNWNNNTASGGPHPTAWWATSPILNVGVQNLSIDSTNAGFGGGYGVAIAFFNASNGWVQGVRSLASSRAHVQAQYSDRITIRGSYFFLAVNSTSTSYGFECYDASDVLVENNIFQAISGPLTINGDCSGSVMGYNYDINNFYTSSAGYINAMSNVHTAGTDNVLYEGNIGPQIYGDVFHGSHNFVTMFRNYLSGNLPACSQSPFGTPYASATFGACSGDQVPISLLSSTRFFNIVGNVLGQTGIQSGYETGGNPIYALGSGDGLNSDANVKGTLMRWGNYDTINAANQFVSSEVPSSLSGVQAPFSNPVPVNNNLPASFYYASKPSWWPSGKAWPLIGPDVTGGNISGLGGHANTNPAEDCYLSVMGGASNGTGGPYAFNAASCYTVSNTQPTPTPPTGLSAIVN